MERVRTLASLMVMLTAFCLSGCAAVVLGGAAAAAGTGTYVYVEGDMKTDYFYSFEDVWTACESVIAKMNALDVVKDKDVGKGKIQAVLDGEKVWFTAKYKADELTSLTVRVGFLGDKVASQRLHDLVADNLKNR